MWKERKALETYTMPCHATPYNIYRLKHHFPFNANVYVCVWKTQIEQPIKSFSQIDIEYYRNEKIYATAVYSKIHSLSLPILCYRCWCTLKIDFHAYYFAVIAITRSFTRAVNVARVLSNVRCRKASSSHITFSINLLTKKRELKFYTTWLCVSVCAANALRLIFVFQVYSFVMILSPLWLWFESRQY